MFPVPWSFVMMSCPNVCTWYIDIQLMSLLLSLNSTQLKKQILSTLKNKTFVLFCYLVIWWKCWVFSICSLLELLSESCFNQSRLFNRSLEAVKRLFLKQNSGSGGLSWPTDYSLKAKIFKTSIIKLWPISSNYSCFRSSCIMVFTLTIQLTIFS